MRSIRVSNHYTKNGMYDVFDAETGDKLLNVYAVELLFSRSRNHARIAFGVSSDDDPAVKITRIEVFDILKADLAFSGTPTEESNSNDHPSEYVKRQSLLLNPDPRDWASDQEEG
jgi:hypothetical protein